MGKVVFWLIISVIAGLFVKSHFDSKEREDEYSCRWVYQAMKDELNDARMYDNLDKIYHTQLAQMNLAIIYQKDCCRFADTCPAAIH